ncbi:hypothetical protein [Mangrovicoccus algicola]|uniref:Uncharacterized protein n=1 Tax=Mangrovicoccus algicola TaxID=2771008 RepID=A0A8J6YW70_9RHOB|nr:hypothetical protein [Mangrovicoccus algicola]MBE3637354.1 hypothetical protein [Mangrovicoccus algicola]
MLKETLFGAIMRAIVFAPADDAGGGSFFTPPADDAGAGAGDDGTPPQGDGGAPEGEGTGDDGTPPSGDGSAPERPEWLLQKYNSVEDQAKAYRDLYGRFSKKTEDLRAEIAAERAEGVPEALDGYAYPEGWEAPGEDVDGALRAWAHENGIKGEAFQSLINDVWAKTMPDPDTELKVLGDNAQERIADVNQWVHKNVEKDHFPVVQGIMTSAAGVAFIESLAGRGAAAGFAPKGGDAGAKPITRESLREMQFDPRYGVDDKYTAEVTAAWDKWGAQQERQR